MNSVSKKGDGINYVYALHPNFTEDGKIEFGQNELDAKILDKLFGDGKSVANFFDPIYFDTLTKFSMEIVEPFSVGAIEYCNNDYKYFSSRIFETLNKIAERRIDKIVGKSDNIYKDCIVTDNNGNFRGLLELQKIGDETNYIVATNPDFLNLEEMVEANQNSSQEE